ncbi:Non-canonical poly(A) RNA polymerase PAPD7 [Chionoecetes opilio]|uniref:Non-canonical poly(A) RNA polymerase PAPD7 n=1 Tax=Chionoecetes opilio TaxID=41210 RepID=A0A8J4Y351_CHIOP|nr:Non-canonical poly(A) RNA polymerase PAPD7 [Chionoecetes opilio]
MLVKQYLKKEGLAEVFIGEVSSHAVTLMATSLLQLQVSQEDQQDLGWVVVRFYFYCYELSYAWRGISVLEGGRYLCKEDVPTVMPGGHRRICEATSRSSQGSESRSVPKPSQPQLIITTIIIITEAGAPQHHQQTPWHHFLPTTATGLPEA